MAERVSGKSREKKDRRLWLVLLLVLLLALAGIGGLFAKYRSDRQREAAMIADNFHFTSNYLTESGGTVSVAGTGETITFDLYNYEEENNTAAVSESNIQYTISADVSGWVISSIVAGTESLSTTASSHTLTADTTGGNGVTHTVTLQYMGTEATPPDVTVTVKSTAPYSKTLKATFSMAGSAEPTWKVENNTNYVLLTIDSNAYSGNVTVSWTEEYSPDNTNELMSEWSDSDPSGTIEIAANTEYELIFVKNTANSAYDGTTSGSGTTITIGKTTGGE